MKNVSDYQYKKIKEQLGLSDVDVVLIQMWFYMIPKELTITLESRLTDIIEERASYKERKHLTNYISTQIWNNGSMNLLNAIHNQTTLDIGFINDQKTVFPLEMLPRISSFDEIAQSDPRATIAKAHGAKIVVK